MAHVGIQRLATGHRQYDGAEREEGHQRLGLHERQRIGRTDRQQHLRRRADRDRTEYRQHREPQHHDRPECHADRAGAAPLHHEEHRQHKRRNRDHVVFGGRRNELQPLDRGEHRDGRRDHAVAVEQRRGADAEHGHAPTQPRLRDGERTHQREQRQRAALAAVIRTHHDRDVLDRDQQHHGPEHQRQHTHHALGIDHQRMVPAEGLLDGIQRAGTDVAIDDPDRAEDELAGAAVPPRRSGHDQSRLMMQCSINAAATRKLTPHAVDSRSAKPAAKSALPAGFSLTAFRADAATTGTSLASMSPATGNRAW